MGEFDPRPGTGINNGFEYEDQMIAYMAVAACNQEDLRDFWIASNVDGLGAWDDIIIFTKTMAGDNKLQFIQLKHKDKANYSIAINTKKFIQDIQKYASDFNKVLTLITNKTSEYKIGEVLKRTNVKFDKIEFILMTNTKFNDIKDVKYSNNYKLVHQNKTFETIMTNKEGSVYKLSTNSRKANVNNFKIFTNQFFIVSQQLGVNNDILLNEIEGQLHFFIETIAGKHFTKHSDVAKFLPKAIKNWLSDKNQTISVSEVKEIITSLILHVLKHSKPITNNCPTLNSNEWAIFQKIIENYQLVAFSSKNCIFKNFFDANSTHCFITCEDGDIALVKNCLKISKNKKVMLFVQNDVLESINDSQVSTLNLIKLLPDNYLALLKDCSITIQGRVTKFETLLNLHPNVKDIFNVDDVLNLLTNKLSIGGSCHMPEYYVSRAIPQICLNVSIIFKLPESFFIIITENNFKESDLQIKSYLDSKQHNSKNITFIEHAEINKTIKYVKKEFKSVHICKLHQYNNDFVLEWLRSIANIEEVKSFIETNPFNLEPTQSKNADLFSTCISKIVITADPGMGKTYFLKELANNYPIHSWVIVVTLNDIDFTVVDFNFQSYLEAYTKKMPLKDLHIFKLYLESKSIVVLFDGFDEVADEENALRFIIKASQNDFKIIVTSREITRELLEQRLTVISYSIEPFTKNDQIEFLRKFFLGNMKKHDDFNINMEETAKEWALNLIEKCSQSHWDEEFTKLPLLCGLLAESYFREYCLKSNPINNTSINLNLISLYENFIDNKFYIHIKNKEKLQSTGAFKIKVINQERKKFLKNHTNAAVQLIFHKAVKKNSKNSKNFLEEIQNAKDKYGIITRVDENAKPVFLHRTFAEYFAAKWLAGIKEAKDDPLKTKLNLLLKTQFAAVRDVFDQLLCRGCELHKAIINANTEKFCKILKENDVNDDVKCGRNSLHLICARGATHESENGQIVRKGEEKYLEMLNILLEKQFECDNTQDEVLKLTPQQYADHRKAFGVIDKLLPYKLYNLQNSIITKLKKQEVLFMCAKYDYANIAENFEYFQKMKIKKELLEKLLEVCIENGSIKFAEKTIQSKKLNANDLTQIALHCEGYGEMGTLIHVTAAKKNFKIFHIFRKYIDINIKDSEGNTALHWICKPGYLESFTALMKNGAKLFLPNNDGETPMDWAVFRKENHELAEYVTSYEVLKNCIQSECNCDDINATLPGKYKRKALHYVVKCNNISSLKELISNKAIVNVTDKDEGTVLHMIGSEEQINTEIVRYLFESNIHINARDRWGQTALHTAAWWGNKELVELLLEQDADTNALNNKEQTALSVAREEGRNDVFLLLREKTRIISNRDGLHTFVLREGDKEEVRRNTFVDYPEELSVLVDNMAKAGLYYEGNNSDVKCFKCDVILWDWVPEDDPWIRHAKLNPRCEFVIQEKGENFIKKSKRHVRVISKNKPQIL